MRSDIRLKKYRKIYRNIQDAYENEYKTVKQACEAEGITPSTYYKICNTLNKRSVGTTAEQAAQNERNKEKRRLEKKRQERNERNQRGGAQETDRKETKNDGIYTETDGKPIKTDEILMNSDDFPETDQQQRLLQVTRPKVTSTRIKNNTLYNNDSERSKIFNGTADDVINNIKSRY